MRARPYLSVLRQQLLNALSKLMAFRISFILNLLAEVATFLSYYLSISILFDHVSHIGGWERAHFMFFAFWVQLLVCVYNTFMAPNFWNFATELRTGALDFRLLRPLGSVFDVFSAYTRPITALLLPVHIGCLIYYGRALDLSTLAWCAFPLVFLCSLGLHFLVELAVIMGCFWTGGGDGINFLRIQGQQLQRWPGFIYPERFGRFFTWYVPVLATTTLSVQFLLDPSRWMNIVFLVLALFVFWIVDGALWARGLRRYESASS